MKIEDVMRKAIVIEDMTLKEAVKIMASKKVGSLIIMEKDKVEGIITESDIAKNISCLDKKVSDVMTKEVINISPKSNLDKAVEIMAEKKIKRLPVVEKGNLVGIITVTDIIANSDDLNQDFFFED